jgi:hypothetical protein
MTVLRRIVFGEPKPGNPPFAAILKKLDESVSYCNRVGTLAHDRITDLPFTIPALGLNLVHPAPLSFVSSAPPVNDGWGLFAEHHMQLYYQGAMSANLDAVHLECARLCRAIYAYPGDPPEKWDASAVTAGVMWGIRFEGSCAYVVFRGSDTFLDWLRDITGFDVDQLARRVTHHDIFGPMWDGFLIGMEETWGVIKPLVAKFDQVIFTGHSLGAARADVAAGYALAGL